MSDLESALREQLAVSRAWVANNYKDSASWIAGYVTLLNEMTDLLDSRPDGWTDLRDRPGDLPDRFSTCQIYYRGTVGNGPMQYQTELAYLDGKGQWFTTGCPTIEIICWKYIEWSESTVPARFKKQEVT